jgi:hypothetical protein
VFRFRTRNIAPTTCLARARDCYMKRSGGRPTNEKTSHCARYAQAQCDLRHRGDPAATSCRRLQVRETRENLKTPENPGFLDVRRLSQLGYGDRIVTAFSTNLYGKANRSSWQKTAALWLISASCTYPPQLNSSGFLWPRKAVVLPKSLIRQSHHLTGHTSSEMTV